MLQGNWKPSTWTWTCSLITCILSALLEHNLHMYIPSEVSKLNCWSSISFSSLVSPGWIIIFPFSFPFPFLFLFSALFSLLFLLRSSNLLSWTRIEALGNSIFGANKVVEQLPISVEPNPHNQRYLETKKSKMGHLLWSWFSGFKSKVFRGLLSNYPHYCLAALSIDQLSLDAPVKQGRRINSDRWWMLDSVRYYSNAQRN